MQDRPGVHALLTAVRDFLVEDALPQLEGRAKLHARVAANAIALVQRELELAPASDAAESERLRALLRLDGERGALAVELARRIREGELALADPELIEHLWSTALEKLAVDNPGYSAYQRAVASK
jgi:hypothetical protein